MKKILKIQLAFFVILMLFFNCDSTFDQLKSDVNSPISDQANQFNLKENVNRIPAEWKNIPSLPYYTFDRIDDNTTEDWPQKYGYGGDRTYILNLNQSEKININIAITDGNIDNYIDVEIFKSDKTSFKFFGYVRVTNTDGIRNIANIHLNQGKYYIVVSTDLDYGCPFNYKIIINQERVSMMSYDLPYQYIRHRGFLGFVSYIFSSLDKEYSTFVMVPGLADKIGCVSFESVNYPGYYLRHQGFRLHLHAYEESDLYREDASFKIKPGLADNRDISLESLNYRNYYIKYISYVEGNVVKHKLDIQKKPSSYVCSRYKYICDEFNKDATFKMMKPLYY